MRRVSSSELPYPRNATVPGDGSNDARKSTRNPFDSWKGCGLAVDQERISVVGVLQRGPALGDVLPDGPEEQRPRSADTRSSSRGMMVRANSEPSRLSGNVGIGVGSTHSESIRSASDPGYRRRGSHIPPRLPRKWPRGPGSPGRTHRASARSVSSDRTFTLKLLSVPLGASYGTVVPPWSTW